MPGNCCACLTVAANLRCCWELKQLSCRALGLFVLPVMTLHVLFYLDGCCCICQIGPQRMPRSVK